MKTYTPRTIPAAWHESGARVTVTTSTGVPLATGSLNAAYSSSGRWTVRLDVDDEHVVTVVGAADMQVGRSES